MWTKVKCSYCENGFRHPVGNCVLCGCGPAPGNMWPLPTTPAEEQLALLRLGFELAYNYETDHAVAAERYQAAWAKYQAEHSST